MSNQWTMATANTYCFMELPGLLSEANVWRFREAYPEHKEIIDKYWERKNVINVDKVLSRDADILWNVIKQCRNLKEVKFLGLEKTSKYFEQLPAVIAQYCPTLEVLDIPGIPLSKKDLISLSTLVSLKSLSINCISIKRISKQLDRLFINNQNLEDVSMFHVDSFDPLDFKNLTKSIVKLVIHAETYYQLGDLFENIDKWQLETLWLPRVILTKDDINKLCKLTTLKFLRLNVFNADDIIRLFSNNPNLESLIICGNSLKKASLKSFPKTIKTLGVTLCHIDWNILIECAKTWNLESLDLHLMNEPIATIIPNLTVALSPSLKDFSIGCCILDDTDVRSIQNLKQLKTLKLMHLEKDFNAALTIIMTSCLDLEVVTLDQVNLLLSQEVFDAMSNLPRLKEIVFKEHYHPTNYVNFMQKLSKGNSLRTAVFDGCEGFNNEAALTLIRDCKTLTYIRIDCPSITPDLVQDTVRALNEQTNRRDTLNVMLKLKNVMTPQDLPPKLELTTYQHSI